MDYPYLLGWKDTLRPIRDGFRRLFPSPDTGPTPGEREKQRQLDLLKGFTYFDTFAQLEIWSVSESNTAQRANTPLLRRPSGDYGEYGRANVLLCHDYAGGYHDYEASTAVGLHKLPYSCGYLQYVDSFVYFSHKLVCVPPPSWTNTLHRNGVKAFGTLLIEPQTKDSDRLLDYISDRKFPFAKVLADIAKHYGFDGYLINIEKPFTVTVSGRVPDLLNAFLIDLKAELGNAGELIWYDALTIDNKIVYCNALTPKNLRFATACGAILTNYCWRESDALLSDNVARQIGLPREKVYLGIDVWAQNKTSLTQPRITYPEKGGGGTNTGVAVNKIADITSVSAGIFAPAWSFEHFPAEEASWDYGLFVERAMWEGEPLPEICGITCSCGDTYQRHKANQELPITRAAIHFPAGSEAFFYTDFSSVTGLDGEKESEQLYNGKRLHSQLGTQSLFPHPSLAIAKDDDGNTVDALKHCVVCDVGKTYLEIDLIEKIELEHLANAGDGHAPLDTLADRILDRHLSLYKLDMPADGTLQLRISYKNTMRVGGTISLYLKFTNGIKYLRLEGIYSDEVQALDYTVIALHDSDKNMRLEELGICASTGVICETFQALEIYEIRIAPHDYLSNEYDHSISDLSIEKRGEGDTEHWRLLWTYVGHQCENEVFALARAGIPYSNLTGPFSYFRIQINGLELGRAYALEHVLPKSFVEGLSREDVKVILVGVGFDGREIARCELDKVSVPSSGHHSTQSGRGY